MTYYPEPNPAPKHTALRGVAIALAAVLVVLIALYLVLFGVPGTGFHGITRPMPSPSVTEDTQTPPPSTTEPPAEPSAPSLDGTYAVDLTGKVPQLPIVDDPEDSQNTYAFYNVEEAHVTVQGDTVTLTLTRLCLTYFENYVCVDQVPLNWTGTLTDNTAVVQDSDHPVSWVRVTIADGQATLSRPNYPPCLLPDGSTVGTGDVVGDLHFTC